MKFKRLVSIFLVVAGLAGVGAYIFGIQQMRLYPNISEADRQMFQSIMQTERRINQPTVSTDAAPSEPVSSQQRGDNLGTFGQADRETFIATFTEELAELTKQVAELEAQIALASGESRDNLIQNRATIRQQIARLHNRLEVAPMIDQNKWSDFARQLTNAIQSARADLMKAKTSEALASKG